MRQIKQIYSTMLWPLISERPDVALVIFPRESSALLTPQVNSSVKTNSFGHIWKLIVKSGEHQHSHNCLLQMFFLLGVVCVVHSGTHQLAYND